MTTTKKTARAGAAALPSERRAHLVRLAGDLFAEKGYRATTVREIADAAGILSGSLYHHFDSKESIGDEILSGFLEDVLAGYRAAVRDTDDPRAAIELIVRSSTATLSRHRAALTMLQNDWNYFSAQPRFAYLRKAMKEIEQTWIDQLERGKRSGQFRSDLDTRLVYRLLRDVLWIPTSWRQSRGAGWGTDQIVEGFLRLLFDGITAPGAPGKAPRVTARATPAKGRRAAASDTPTRAPQAGTAGGSGRPAKASRVGRTTPEGSATKATRVDDGSSPED